MSYALAANTLPRAARPTTEHEVSLFRLYLLRATYLFIAVGLGLTIWPAIIHHGNHLSVMHGAAICLLGAIGLLAVVGLRHPLRMLPLLLFELVWKTIWFVAIARPLWSAGLLDANIMETVNACLMGVILMPIAIPWGYVWTQYVSGNGERWR